MATRNSNHPCLFDYLETVKKCPKCLEWKVLEEITGRKKLGHCKSCKRATLRECVRRYRKKHPEASRKSNERYRKKHPEVFRKANKVWRSKNPEGYKKATREWKAKNPEAFKLIQRRIALKRKYGLTVEQYQAMLDSQGGLCAICRQPEGKTSNRGEPISLSVDHCHTTGRVRQLLCVMCNIVVGCSRERPEVLLAAVEYLKRHNGAKAS